jgi:hypothetical protein
VQVWTIEHNNEPWREDTKTLMQQHGYSRVLEDFSRYDDWYLHRDIQKRL